MKICSCNFKCTCSLYAFAASIILGIIGAFLQITAVITVTPAFLSAVLWIAIAYLGILVIAAALMERCVSGDCLCAALNALLLGILGTILFSAILLAVGIVATSVVTAILVGIVLFFLSLTFTSSACFVKSLAAC